MSSMHNHTVKFSALWFLVCVLLLQGCASIYKPQNDRVTHVDTDAGYHVTAKQRRDLGEHRVVLSFSGGGTRAAALSYGVLQELRDTQVDARGTRIRLLDDVDNISSVSGGSFTSAYYGLFGDQIFDDYESAFLRQSIQGTLIRKLLNPAYWWRSMFTGLDRTEMAVEYYDQTIFKGKTFADIRLDKGPFIEINSTDLSSGSRFSFTQGMFDLICSDLNTFHVARAVTASSAVPVAFPPVVLQNYAGQCDIGQSAQWNSILHKPDPTPREAALRERFSLLQDTTGNPYLHLVDGGISDNLGMRAMIERVDAMGGVTNNMSRVSPNIPKDVLIILVNAAVKPAQTMNQTADKPSVTATVGAFTDAQMRLYTMETHSLIRQRMQEYEQELHAAGYDIHFYFAEVNFESIKTPSIKNFFNNLPTSLELNNDQVDSLIAAGRKLLRENPEYQAFMQANNGTLALEEKKSSCNQLLNPLCLFK